MCASSLTRDGDGSTAWFLTPRGGEGAAGVLHDHMWQHARQTSHLNDAIVANLKLRMTRAAAIDADLKVLVEDTKMFRLSERKRNSI